MLTLTLKQDKVTKRTVRFVELDEDGEESFTPVLGSLYVNRGVLRTMGDPSRIGVVLGTLEELGDDGDA